RFLARHRGNWDLRAAKYGNHRADQAEIGFVDQSGRLERLTGRFLSHLAHYHLTLNDLRTGRTSAIPRASTVFMHSPLLFPILCLHTLAVAGRMFCRGSASCGYSLRGGRMNRVWQTWPSAILLLVLSIPPDYHGQAGHSRAAEPAPCRCWGG